MERKKPKIKAFQWNDVFMAIDWDCLTHAFSILVQTGSAKIFLLPVAPSTLGIQVGLPVDRINHFTLRDDPESSLVEVVFETTWRSGEESLGLTDQVETATRWVADANEIVRRARERFGHGADSS